MLPVMTVEEMQIMCLAIHVHCYAGQICSRGELQVQLLSYYAVLRLLVCPIELKGKVLILICSCRLHVMAFHVAD